MTNYEKIKEKIKGRISVRLIAEIASELTTSCEVCKIRESCNSNVCKTAWTRWLESEAEEYAGSRDK